MKAIVLRQFGAPNVLVYGDYPTPAPKLGEALVRVKSCALNHLDLHLRHGVLGIPLPHIMGSDVAGTVEQLNGKSDFKIGDEVVVNPAIACGTCARCRQGLDCEKVGIFGYNTFGGYAEYVCAPIAQLHPKPKSLNWVEAAGFPLTFLTAWRMLHTKAKLQRGETVFIWGASGGLGTAAVQIAKASGARVIAAARSGENASALKRLGADETVEYAKENVVEVVQRLTKQQGVDVVFECVGKETWERTIAMARFHGRIVIAGTASGDVASQDLSEVYYKQLSIHGSRMGTAKEFGEALSFMEQKKLKPMVDRTFPLREASKAHERLESRQQLGKIVLEV